MRQEHREEIRRIAGKDDQLFSAILRFVKLVIKQERVFERKKIKSSQNGELRALKRDIKASEEKAAALKELRRERDGGLWRFSKY